MPESSSQSYETANAELKEPVAEEVSRSVTVPNPISTYSLAPKNQLESNRVRFNTQNSPSKNRSRAIGVELITRRSFDNINDELQEAPDIVTINPKYIELVEPKIRPVMVKLGIKFKVDPKAAPREEEEDEAPNVEIAQAYTVFGEPCKDACLYRGYSYTWCNKKVSSDIGNWKDSE